MSFVQIMLAVFCGVLLRDFVYVVVGASFKCAKERMSKRDRKIGFGDRETKESKTKGATMRKIGFGAND